MPEQESLFDRIEALKSAGQISDRGDQEAALNALSHVREMVRSLSQELDSIHEYLSSRELTKQEVVVINELVEDLLGL
jgi:hypothetical protein